MKDRFLRDGAKDKADAERTARCDMSSVAYFSAECRAMRKSALADMLSYTVLTK